MNLGERIYDLRNKKNLSQGDLADRLDVSRQSISKWENNMAVPDLDKLIKLCDIFEISLDELVGREEPKEKPTNKIEQIKNNLTKTQQIGCALIGIAIICALLPYGLLLTPTLLACGIICLLVKKNPWYWCIWVAFLPLLYLMGWAIISPSIIIEAAFLVVMAFATYKALKNTDIVISKKKSIIILTFSIVFDLIYILYRIITLGDFDFLENGIIGSTVYSGVGYGLVNVFVMIGVGLSMIGITVSVKNLRKK